MGKSFRLKPALAGVWHPGPRSRTDTRSFGYRRYLLLEGGLGPQITFPAGKCSPQVNRANRLPRGRVFRREGAACIALHGRPRYTMDMLSKAKESDPASCRKILVRYVQQGRLRQAGDDALPPGVWEREFRYVMAYWLEGIPEIARDPAICERACRHADAWACEYSQMEYADAAMRKLDELQRKVVPATYAKNIAMAVVAVLVSVVMVITMIPR